MVNVAGLLGASAKGKNSMTLLILAVITPPAFLPGWPIWVAISGVLMVGLGIIIHRSRRNASHPGSEDKRDEGDKR